MEEEQEIAQILRERSRRFRTLEKEHHQLDAALRDLSRRKMLTPHEEIQKKEAQKKKLVAKDGMVEMIRYYKTTGNPDLKNFPMSV